MPGSGSTIDVRPLAVHIGAEIGGVDLRKPLAPDTVTAIRDALLQWKVVFFRDQHLNHAQHVAFARQFGDPTPAHVVFVGQDDEHPEIYSIAKHRTAISTKDAYAVRPWTGWHTDITAAINPPMASILRGVTVPPYGGDTQWTNLAAAFCALSPAMQAFISGLRGVHRFDEPRSPRDLTDYDRAVANRLMVSEHPLVRVHPETREKVLYVNPGFLRSITGLTPQEGVHLMEMLYEHMIRPEFTVRFRWSEGAIAFWDNRATAHLAPTDIFATEFERQFYRVTLTGDVPVGPDGQPSTALEGAPIEAVG